MSLDYGKIKTTWNHKNNICRKNLESEADF